MTTNTTTTENAAPASPARQTARGWLWFIGLWCTGVGAAVLLGLTFRLLMDLTLFAVK
ncbi:hypothetical protein [Pandoraea sp.]|uniref:hypothetical protein n=1 Tax=Pandoraea sp. TaxID=1883445 RepID=UPI0025F60165|nr:hypothetical protein [Pandoraea sp.]